MSHFSRRSFLHTAGSLAAAGLPAWFLAEEAARAQEQTGKKKGKGKGKKTAAATDAAAPTTQPKLPVVLIGCGGRGTYVASNPTEGGGKYFNVLAVCDVNQKHAEGVVKKNFPNAEIFHDFRDCIEKAKAKGAQAVINGCPDHWHTLINIHAMRQGFDVYSEKPLTLTIEEGQKVIEVKNETKRILQTGSQQRSDAKFRLACELVRNGRIGKLVHVTTLLPQGASGGPFEPQPVPEGFDWEFWQGQAPRHPFLEERADARFRWWWDYSEGTITDWGAHHHDIALWGMGMDHSGPVSIDGRANGTIVPGGYTTAPYFYIEYLYPNGVTMTSIAVNNGGPAYGLKPDPSETKSSDSKGSKETTAKVKAKIEDKGWKNGVKFEGADGWIFVARGRIEASHPDILSEPLSDSAIRLYHSDNHFANFCDAVRTRKESICPPEIGHRSASVCHLGALSVRLNRKLYWDPQKEEFKNDAEANAMRSRKMHEPWGYDKV